MLCFRSNQQIRVTTFTLFVTTATLLIFAHSARTDEIALSKSDNIGNMLGGLTFTDGDVVSFCDETNMAALLFAETLIAPSADIDAFTILPNGNYVLSVLFNNRTLGGLEFDDGDLIEYNPLTGVASIFFLGEGDFSSASSSTIGDINAVDWVADRFVVFSLTTSGTIFRGVDYNDGDLIQYSPSDDQVTVLIQESTLCDDGDCDIDAVHVLDNGNYVLSTFSDEMINGQLFFNGDLFEYNAATDTATLYFSEANFTDTNGHNIDAVYASEAAVGDNLGDMNCDDVVDLNDVAPFVQALLDPPGYMMAFPACDINRADTDENGNRDGADVAGFLDRLL